MELNEQWRRHGSELLGRQIMEIFYRAHRNFRFYSKSDGEATESFKQKKVQSTFLKDNCIFYIEKDMNFRNTRDVTGQTENYFKSLCEK